MSSVWWHRRAYLLARRVLAVLTADGQKPIRGMPSTITDVPYPRARREDAVPPEATGLGVMILADDRAGPASYAAVKVDGHCVFIA